MFNDFDLISAKEMRNRQEGLKDRDEIVKKIIKSLKNILQILVLKKVLVHLLT